MSNPTTREKLREEFLQEFDFVRFKRDLPQIADYWLDKLESELTLREARLRETLEKDEVEVPHYYTNPRGEEMVYLKDVLALLPPTSEDNLNEQ